MAVMDDGLDLRDQRGRLVRLGISAAIGIAVTAVVMHLIGQSGPPANTDPVGASTVPLLAIAVFVVVTAFVSTVLARIATRRRRR
jgi:hypothetical protein